MAGMTVGAVGSGMSRAQLDAQIQAAVLVKQKEALQQQGEQEVKLIQQAMSAAPDAGRRLDVRV